MSNFKTSASNLQYYEENSPLMQKFTKKLMSEFHAAVLPKLGLENTPKFGGRLSHEFGSNFCINFINMLH